MSLRRRNRLRGDDFAKRRNRLQKEKFRFGLLVQVSGSPEHMVPEEERRRVSADAKGLVKFGRELISTVVYHNSPSHFC